jgi:phosphatidylserine decarboxylase
MLSSYGTSNIIVMGLAATLLLALGVYFTHTHTFLSVIFYLLAFILYAFTLWFFRDPERTVPAEAINDSTLIVSPADGVITEIVREVEPFYLQSETIRISIFLSPLDVHVNRIPISGQVEFYKYTPGKYIIANHPKASELNEQTKIGVKIKSNTDTTRKILFKQIVGIVARRLVCDLKVGDSIKVGDRFGMMKFGSRMDIAVPIDTEIFLKIGDKVRAGETIVAKLR